MPISVQIALLAAAVLVLAYCFAKVEIHIEGGDGWAANLPTWRIDKHWLLDVFFGGRPLTGYHAWMLPFMALMFHFPAALTCVWSWQLEARAVACMMLFWVFEDFLWFVLNPAWGWTRFTKAEVRWHRHWLLRFPTDYWTFLVLGGGLLGWSFF